MEWLPVWGLIAGVFLIACASCLFDPAALAKANGHLWTQDTLGFHAFLPAALARRV